MSGIRSAVKAVEPSPARTHAREKERHDMEKPHWPMELKLTEQGRMLRVVFESGEVFDLPAEYLRAVSPSAEIQGHAPEQKRTVAGKRDVAVTGLEPVGNYAVQIAFDDRHASGIYTWDYLYEIGASRDQVWTRRLEDLKSKGLPR
jgi:DUF971 family protein